MSGSDVEDDEEAPLADQLHPESDVYSYSMLAAPKQMKERGSFTTDAFMSYLLVGLVLAIQGVMLYCVYDKVVVNNAKWQNSIMKVDGSDWSMNPTKGECATGRSLCLVNNNTYSCAPPSVQLTGRWDELDADGDGIWTMEEVLQTRKELQCKYVVDPLEIFNVFVNMLREREKLIWLHPDLKAGKAIHKAYFTYAMGDVAMCGYRSQDMCNNLLKRGVFHAALKYGTAPRVGITVESALDYCREMLQPMGMCERFLPSTYATWKIESIVQCETPKYTEFVYKNPGNGVKKSLLEVDYKARQKFETAQTFLFQIYKGSICGVWVLLIVSQLRNVWKVLVWAMAIEVPVIEEETGGGRRGVRKRRRSVSGDDNGMTTAHKVTMIAVTLARMAMLCILMYVGLSFLGRQTDYIGLLLDGVALLFIIEVAEIIYERVIRADVRHEYEDGEPVTFKKAGIPYLDNKPDRADMLWLLIVISISVVFIRYYTTSVVSPLLDSLNCACRSDGEHCYEAHRFSKTFWDKYWHYDVPGVITQINSLKGGFSVWGHGGSLAKRLHITPGH
jgi:hypothetical protein